MNTILEERDAAVAYLSDKDTLLFTHAELADLIDAFVDHLKCNRDVLVRTGRYRIDFGRSGWLHASLTNLYYTKLPSYGSNIRIGLAKEKDRLSLDSCGHHLPIDQYQANCYHVNTTGECREFKGIDTPECGFLETDSFSELDSSASQRIETNRADFFSLKLRVLSILRNAVANRDSLNLWADCLDVLTQTLTGEEAEFYLKMDRFYLGYDLMTGEILEETDLRPGGLTNLLEFIGYCEKEITIGTMHHSKEALAAANLAFRTEYGQNTWREKDANTGTYHLGSGSVAYRDYNDDTRSDRLDSILDRFIQMDLMEADFWTGFMSRVNGALQAEFRDEVTVQIKVRRKFLESFKPSVQSFAEIQKVNQEITGMLIPLSISPAATPEPQPDNVFRNEGEYWNLTFFEKTIHMERARGLDYLSYLLQHPNQEVTSIDLRFAFQSGTGMKLGFTETGPLLDEGMSVSDFGDAGEILDRQANDEYKKAIRDLQEELDEAERFNNPEQATQLREHIQMIEAQLSNAHGLGGRNRKAADVPDRARKAVSSAVSRSLSKIQNAHPSLGLHLKNSIKMGRICSYNPESPTNWDQ